MLLFYILLIFMFSLLKLLQAENFQDQIVMPTSSAEGKHLL